MACPWSLREWAVGRQRAVGWGHTSSPRQPGPGPGLTSHPTTMCSRKAWYLAAQPVTTGLRSFQPDLFPAQVSPYVTARGTGIKSVGHLCLCGVGWGRRGPYHLLHFTSPSSWLPAAGSPGCVSSCSYKIHAESQTESQILLAMLEK